MEDGRVKFPKAAGIDVRVEGEAVGLNVVSDQMLAARARLQVGRSGSGRGVAILHACDEGDRQLGCERGTLAVHLLVPSPSEHEGKQ